MSRLQHIPVVRFTDKKPRSSDQLCIDPMPPLTLTQDRLARGQNPSSRSTSGPSRPQSNRSGAEPKSPIKVRVPKGLPANDPEGRGRLEAGEEPTTETKENDMWEESQRRHKAAVILGSWEMVTWYGIAGDEVRSYLLLTELEFLRCHCLEICQIDFSLSYFSPGTVSFSDGISLDRNTLPSTCLVCSQPTVLHHTIY